MRYFVIDNGGTFIKYAMIDENGVISERGKVKTPGKTAMEEDYLSILDGLILPLRNEIKGIAISTPGRVNDETGELMTAGSLAYLAGKNLKQIIEERYHIPTSVENDGKSAVLAEMWKGSLVGVKNGAAVVFGTGIGGGLVLDGKLYKGETFAAGEINNMVFSPTSEFSMRALSTASISTLALCYMVATLKKLDLKDVSGEDVFAWLEAGDEEVKKIFDRYTRNVAYGLFSLQAVLDLNTIALGGGISREKIFVEKVRDEYNAIYDNEGFHAIGGCSSSKARIVACKFDNDANLYGALYHHIQEQKSA